MSRLLVADSGGTVRTILNSRAFVVDSGGVTRNIRRGFVIDSGGVARQFLQARANETGQITAGQNGSGGAYGYQRGTYGSVLSWPISGGTLSDNVQINAIRDSNLTGAGGDARFQLTPPSGALLQNYFFSITVNGQTRLSSAATFSNSGGTYIWVWTAQPFNLLAGNTYNPITIAF